MLLPAFLLFSTGQEGLAQSGVFVPDSSGMVKDYVLEIWDNSNGLPQNAVFALEKDNLGYLWIATEEGLVRFDGGSTKIFDQDAYPEMLEVTYYTFFKTEGGIWATGDRSIALLEKNIKKVIDCSEIAKNTWIRAIAENGNGGLLIGNQRGEIFSWDNGTFRPLEFWKPQQRLEILGFLPLENSKLLVGTSRGLYEFDLKSREAVLVSPDDLWVQKVFGNGKNLYVFSPEQGMFRLGPDYKMERMLKAEECKDINPSSLIVDSEDRILAGSLEKGLILIEDGKVHGFSYPELKNYTVRKIIKEDDNLYLGTLGRGLALVKPAKVHQLNYRDLRQKNIKAVFQSSDSSIWIGTKSEGLHRIKGGQLSTLTTADGLLQNAVSTIGASEGLIYAGSTSGISVIDMDSGKVVGKITQDEGLTSNYVYAVYRDSKGWLWVLTRYGGIHYFDQDGVLHKVPIPEAYSGTSFVSILELKNGQVVIGSMNQGLFRFENGKFVQNQILPLTPGEDVIYCIYEDKDEALWLGTHGGIVVLEDGEFQVLRKRHGLKSRSVYSIISDGRDGVWISNNFGIQYFANSELDRFKNHPEVDFFIANTLYNESQGMPNSEANGLIFPSALRDFTGKIWIPTVEGIGIVEADPSVDGKPNQSHFIWDELQVADRKTAIGDAVEIPQGIGTFQVSFSLVDFDNQAQYSLFYRIDPNTELWHPIKEQRQLTFNGLKPGHYDLEVKILRHGKLEETRTLPIVVSASLVETTGFKVFVAAALFLLAIFMVKYYFNIKLKRKLERMVSLRTSELSQANVQLKDALSEIESKNSILMDITWSQSHLVRAPLTKAMGINQLLIKYPRYTDVGKSKEQLEIELMETLKQLDRIVKETHSKSENLKKQ